MPETTITIEGNLTADPEMRALPSGIAVSNFTVASTPRKYDRNTQEWSDLPTMFFRVAAWRDLAEGATDILRKGDSVIVKGKLENADYEKDGVKRTAFQITAEAIGKSVKARRTASAGAGANSSSSGSAWGSPASDAPPF